MALLYLLSAAQSRLPLALCAAVYRDTFSIMIDELRDESSRQGLSFQSHWQ